MNAELVIPFCTNLFRTFYKLILYTLIFSLALSASIVSFRSTHISIPTPYMYHTILPVPNCSTCKLSHLASFYISWFDFLFTALIFKVVALIAIFMLVAICFLSNSSLKAQNFCYFGNVKYITNLSVTSYYEHSFN